MSKKVLFIVTSAKSAPWGKDTGYWLEEVAAPYNHLIDNGFDVEIASIIGGEPPVDPLSQNEPYTTEDTVRFLADSVAQSKISSTKPVSEFIDRATSGEFKAVFLPGGHGAALDFHTNNALKQVVEQIYTHGGVVSAVCHGPCGLVNIDDLSTGRSILRGKRVTAFSDVEEGQAGLTAAVPFSLECEFKRLGGLYEAAEPWTPFAIVDGRLVTGQNPASSKQVAEKLVEVLNAI